MPERLGGRYPGAILGMPEQSDNLLQPKDYRYESEPSQIRGGDGHGNSRAKQACGKQRYYAEVLAKKDCDLCCPTFSVQAEQQKKVIHVGCNKEHEAQAN